MDLNRTPLVTMSPRTVLRSSGALAAVLSPVLVLGNILDSPGLLHVGIALIVAPLLMGVANAMLPRPYPGQALILVVIGSYLLALGIAIEAHNPAADLTSTTILIGLGTTIVLNFGALFIVGLTRRLDTYTQERRLEANRRMAKPWDFSPRRAGGH